MSYRQLIPEQRYQIYACLKAGWTQLKMAAEIGVHPSTISRELSRNRGGRGYRPKQAHELAEGRKLNHVTRRISAETWTGIAGYLRQDWSPEQVAGYLDRKSVV